MDSFLKNFFILSDHGASAAHVDLHFQKVAQTQDHLLDLVSQFSSGSQNQSLGFIDGSVDELEGGDGEGAGLTHTGLGLRDGVFAFQKGDDSLLLDDGRLFVTVSVDTSEEVFIQIEVIKAVHAFEPVGFDIRCNLLFLFHRVFR